MFFFFSRSPSKLGNMEKTSVENSILLALRILIKILHECPHHLCVAARIFDPSITFYGGAFKFHILITFTSLLLIENMGYFSIPS
jgi:hypothetical protein